MINFEELNIGDLFDYYDKTFVKISDMYGNGSHGRIKFHPKDKVDYIDREALKGWDKKSEETNE